MPRRYDLVIFDFDGTLADSLAWFRGAFDEAARHHGIATLAPCEYEALRGAPLREIMRRFAIPAWKMAPFAATMRRLAARDVSTIRLFDGARDAIEALEAGGARVAVVSSNAEANVRQVLGADLAARVSDFACGAAIFGKPARFRALRRRHRLEGARVLSIGDELRDLEAARAAGVAAGAVSWGFATPAALAAGAPDHLFERFDRIPATVLG